jgi:hypothetical protein
MTRKVHRGASRRGKATRSKEPDGLSAYINGMFKSDEGELRDYESNAQMFETMSTIKEDVSGPLNDCIRDLFAAGRDAAAEFAEEFQKFEEDLIEQTPWDEDGPTTPTGAPVHAADVWSLDFYPTDNGFTMTVYNPQPYMVFLEAGWSPQADAGWIAAAWTLFVMRVEGRVNG